MGDTPRRSGGFCRARAAPILYGKNRSESSVGGRNVFLRPEGQSSVVTEAVTRVTNLPEGAERSSIFIRGPCAPKSRTSEERNGAHPKQRSRGGLSAHSSQHRGSERNGCEGRRPG